ncbi:MAG: aspartate kinase [Paracoccaceae bacterium]|nr:aspartate kinase [Paracoccaceae bacterium]MDE2917208.1 aspartate kinase [Paracoccaceae bacterium]
MAKIVMKFGGTSVADLERMRIAASYIKEEVDKGNEVIVIVSAMAGETNKLVETVNSVSSFFDAREYDAVVSSGENVTSGILALILQDMDIPARSWQGWQVPITTSSTHSSARIMDICTQNVNAKFDEGLKVAVVAGFQGISEENRITTLGRGGSDLTAVAFAAKFDCKRCDIFTDVDGVYTADPRIVFKARKLNRISYDEMLELASLGAKVLQTRSVQMAMAHQVPVYVRSSFTGKPGTLVCSEDEKMENRTISGIAHSRDEAKISIISVADRPGIAATIFGALSDHGVIVDMIVQNISESGRTDITFSCPLEQSALAEKALLEAKEKNLVNFHEILQDLDVCKISVVGIGMRSQSGVAAKMFSILADEGINIQIISTSEIKISVLVERKYMELAVQALHDKFELHANRISLEQ